MDTCAIAIPIYKSTLSDNERNSFSQCLKIFGNRSIILITHKDIELAEYLYLSDQDNNINIEYFEKTYFIDIKGYNKLLLNVNFYKRFLQFKYILIYQLDSWVFTDNLNFWCNLNYDYIGAPWINWEWSEFHARTITIPRLILSKLGFSKFNMVGNGGFSLRNIKACINNLTFFQTTASSFMQNEDYFFSFFINSYNPFFRVAPFDLALKFSFDENPDKAFELNNNELPMGCHAWPKYPDFWFDKIK